MKRLTLLRHAQADALLPDRRDWDRPLNRRGLLDAKEMARRIKTDLARPELILISPSIRTQQTAEFLCKCFTAAKLLALEELYLAERKQLLSTIHEYGGSVAHLLVVAHNPGISEFADWLSCERRIDNMPTCGVATMEFELGQWHDLQPASGVNVEFDYPQRCG